MFLFSKVATITNKELLEKLASRPRMIDVREKHEFAAGHIPGAENIPLNKIKNYKKKETGKVYVICQSGMRSKQAVQTLKEKGYDAVNLKGGMLLWQGPTKGGNS